MKKNTKKTILSISLVLMVLQSLFAAPASKDKNDKNSKILNSLNTNMDLYYTGKYVESGKGFVDTQVEMQAKTDDLSGGKKFAAAMAGENAVPYVGSTYERMLTYSMTVINALSKNDVDNAVGVMTRYTGDDKEKIQAFIQEQNEYLKQSEKSTEGEEMQKKMDALKALNISLDLNEVNSNKPRKSTDPAYEKSELLNYLGTIVYKSAGEEEHAKEFAKLVSNKQLVEEEFSIPDGKGRLDVVALSGLIGKRTEKDIGPIVVMDMVPVAMVPLKFKLAYPVFEEQSHEIDYVEVTLSDGSSKKAVVVEDFDEAVKNDVETKAYAAYNRSVFRNISKGVVSITSGIAAVKGAEETMKQVSSNPLTAKAAEVALNKAMEALRKGLDEMVNAEKADVRQCEKFPNKVSAAGFYLDPGKYDVTVSFCSKNGSVVEAKKIKGVIVEAGKTSICTSNSNK